MAMGGKSVAAAVDEYTVYMICGVTGQCGHYCMVVQFVSEI